MQVLTIRNRLCHLDVGSKLQIPDEDLNDYFSYITRLVFTMENLGHFSKDEGHDLYTKLSQVLFILMPTDYYILRFFHGYNYFNHKIAKIYNYAMYIHIITKGGDVMLCFCRLRSIILS